MKVTQSSRSILAANLPFLAVETSHSFNFSCEVTLLLHVHDSNFGSKSCSCTAVVTTIFCASFFFWFTVYNLAPCFFYYICNAIGVMVTVAVVNKSMLVVVCSGRGQSLHAWDHEQNGQLYNPPEGTSSTSCISYKLYLILLLSPSLFWANSFTTSCCYNVEMEVCDPYSVYCYRSLEFPLVAHSQDSHYLPVSEQTCQDQKNVGSIVGPELLQQGRRRGCKHIISKCTSCLKISSIENRTIAKRIIW